MIRITASGKKGAAPRELAREVDETIAMAREVGGVPAEHIAAIRSGQSAANKLIFRAPRGSEISVQLMLEDDPRGGWQLNLVVDASPAPARFDADAAR